MPSQAIRKKTTSDAVKTSVRLSRSRFNSAQEKAGVFPELCFQYPAEYAETLAARRERINRKNDARGSRRTV